MHEVTIRDLDEAVVRELESIAWRRGVSFDEATRAVLTEATGAKKTAVLVERFSPCTD